MSILTVERRAWLLALTFLVSLGGVGLGHDGCPRASVTLGQGFDPLRPEVVRNHGYFLDQRHGRSLMGAGTADIVFDSVYATSRKELFVKLKFDARLDVTLEALGAWGEAHDSLDFVQDESRIVYIVFGTKQFSALRLSGEPGLSEKGIKEVAKAGVNEFLAKAGSELVEEVSNYVVLGVRIEVVSTMKDFVGIAKRKFGGKLPPFSGKGQLRAEYQTVDSNVSIHCSLYQTAGLENITNITKVISLLGTDFDQARVNSVVEEVLDGVGRYADPVAVGAQAIASIDSGMWQSGKVKAVDPERSKAVVQLADGREKEISLDRGGKPIGFDMRLVAQYPVREFKTTPAVHYIPDAKDPMRLELAAQRASDFEELAEVGRYCRLRRDQLKSLLEADLAAAPARRLVKEDQIEMIQKELAELNKTRNDVIQRAWKLAAWNAADEPPAVVEIPLKPRRMSTIARALESNVTTLKGWLITNDHGAEIKSTLHNSPSGGWADFYLFLSPWVTELDVPVLIESVVLLGYPCGDDKMLAPRTTHVVSPDTWARIRAAGGSLGLLGRTNHRNCGDNPAAHTDQAFRHLTEDPSSKQRYRLLVRFRDGSEQIIDFGEK